MDKEVKIELTPLQQAKLLVEKEFEKAQQKLIAKRIEPTAENLLKEFKQGMTALLATNLDLMWKVSSDVRTHEVELYSWLCKTKELLDQLSSYRKKLDTKSIEFLKTTQKTFEESVKRILTPSNN